MEYHRKNKHQSREIDMGYLKTEKAEIFSNYEKFNELYAAHWTLRKIKDELHPRVEEVFFRYIKARRWSFERKDEYPENFRECLGLEEWGYSHHPYAIKVTITWKANSGLEVTKSFFLPPSLIYDEEALKFFEEDEKWKSENKDNLVYDEPVMFSSSDGYDVYTIKEFKDLVFNGVIVDSDGVGHPVKNKKACGEWEVYPSRIHEIPIEATHIVWYNN